MAAKPRINLRFRPDLLARIEKLVDAGKVKNLTAALEEGAELFLKRAERRRPGPLKRSIPARKNGGPPPVQTDQKYARDDVQTKAEKVRPLISDARRGVTPRPKGSSAVPKRKR